MPSRFKGQLPSDLSSAVTPEYSGKSNVLKIFKAFPANKNPHNILIISSAFSPHIFGGAEIAAYNRAKLLAKRGHNVSVVTLNERNVSPSWGEQTPDGFKLYRIKTPRSYTLYERTQNRFIWKKVLWHLQDYFDNRNQKLITPVLDDAKPDHVEIDNIIGLGFNVLSEIARRDLPVAYVLHDLNLACFNTGMIRKGKICKRQCLSCRGISTLRQINLNKIKRLGFISPSYANLERAKKFVPSVGKSALSCVIRNVPEPIPLLPERKKSDHVRLLFVGRLDPVKGIEFLLNTLNGLSSYNFHLTVLGTGLCEAALKEKYGHKKWVTFGGFVPKNEVTAALKGHDLYCIPSLVMESYGLATAQALQLGTPVIGSNSGGTAELVRDGVTGLLVPPGDAKAWREAFLRIFSDRELLNTWQENAALHAHEFDENEIGQAYEEFINKLSQLA